MIHVKVQDQNYKVRFFHDHECFTFRYAGERSIPINGLTTCQIEGPKATFDEGTAWCSEDDVFNKEIGRKVSLSKALKAFPRGIRKEFWTAYFGRKPSGR